MKLVVFSFFGSSDDVSFFFDENGLSCIRKYPEKKLCSVSSSMTDFILNTKSYTHRAKDTDMEERKKKETERKDRDSDERWALQ